jgi:hypothetical protein
MKVKLEIVNKNNEVVHNRKLEYDGAIPLPLVGEDIAISGERWTVTEREFLVLDDGMKVALWCEGPKELLDEKY